jgi:Fe-S-cluster-containing hydrogenase component 2
MEKNKFIVCDIEKCSGCRICEMVCSAVKDRGFNPLLSRIRVIKSEPLINMAVACRICEDPQCVKSCPTKALQIDEKTGVILINKEKCNGCKWCLEACEFGVIFIQKEEGKAIICDLCQLNPKCIEYCPKEALKLMSSEELGQKNRRKALNKLIS